jgi:hypothetical protein
MAVLAIFTHDVKPGRMADFMAKLQAAAASKFDTKIMPKGFTSFATPCRDRIPAALL